MTGPSPRHWLTGLVFAVLAHVALAALLMGLTREQPREAVSGDPAGLEVTLFPGFREAIQVIAPAGPPAPGPEAVPAPPVSVLPADLTPEEAPAATASLVPTPESPPEVAVESAPSLDPAEVSRAREPAPIAELVEASPAPEPSPPAAATTPSFPTSAELVDEVPVAGPEPPPPFVARSQPAPAEPSALPIETVAALEPEAALQPVTRETSPPMLAATPVESVTALAPVPAIQSIAPEPTPTSSPAAPIEAVTAAAPERAVQPVAPASSAAPAPLVEPLPPEPVESAPLASIEEATTAGDVPGTIASAMPADPVPVAATSVSEPESAATGPPPSADAETIPSVDAVPLGPETVTGAREAAQPTGTAAEVAPDRDEDAASEQPAPQPTTWTREVAGVEERYFATLRDWLDRHKDYPRIAQRRGEEGTVWLAFTLNRHGMVLNHAIVRSSGHTILDNTVEHLIRRAQPLPAIPPELETDLLRLRIPIEFRLER